ncbi:MAG: ABC transporter ATP-binding protein [Proteobacteria bacterium]|nr:ABC transporter ATP-binding protein [Pseudomonadota bacterium]MBS0270318.1 ABC transporter ATP-binding protein [Pseudomonadota bacterium]
MTASLAALSPVGHRVAPTLSASVSASETASRELVGVRGVTKTFGAGVSSFNALEGVSVSIKRNEFFTLLGPSGCGKTTLLRLLAGFDQPTSGQILLDGDDIAGLPPNKRPVNTVFQSYALFPHLTVEQNVEFGLVQQGVQREARQRTVERMLQLVRLDHIAKRKPNQLSGGQQQRVALARALAPQPRILLLDEPLSALDFKLRRGMQVELERIQRETGISFVLVTHDQEEALSMSDRIAVMDAGRILQVGNSTEIYERPNCRFVADFIGEANLFPGSAVGWVSPYVAVRPERVVLAIHKQSMPISLPGTVKEISYLGATTAFTIELTDGSVVKSQRNDAPQGLDSGSTVWCSVHPEHIIELEG